MRIPIHNFRTALMVWISSAAIALALFLPAYTPLDGYDWLRMHVFYKAFYRDALHGGHLPLWNPYAALGRPFLADIETATFYPPNLLYLLGVMPGFFISIVAHLALLIWGGLRCSRRLGCSDGPAWFSALALALGSPIIGRLQAGQVQVFCTLCWLPLLVDLGCDVQDRPSGRRRAGFALAWALMFLAGSPPFFWVAATTSVVYLIVRHPAWVTLRELALAGGLAIGLSAVQLLPFLELVREGNRALQDPAFASSFAQDSSYWWSLLRSRAPGHLYYWEYNLYLGLPAGILAACSLRWLYSPALRPLFVVVICFSIFAAGSATPVLPWFASHLPGWGALRVPARYTLATTFAVTLLAGVVLEHVSKSRMLQVRTWLPLLSIGALIVLNSADLARAYTERANYYARPIQTLREETIVTILRHEQQIDPPRLPAPRLLAPNYIARENSGMAEGYSLIVGFSNPMLARVWDALHVYAHVDALPLERIFIAPGVFTADPARFRPMSLTAYWDPSQQKLFRTLDPGPRVYLAPATISLPSWEEANRRIANGHPFQSVAILETPAPDTTKPVSNASSSVGNASITAFTRESVTANVAADGPRYVVFAEAWYPGWKAQIDGRDARVLPANGWMRAVPVPAGPHTVRLTFHSAFLGWGAAISFISGVGVILMWTKSRPSPEVSRLS